MNRMDRVNSQIKKEISRVVHQELGDPRLQFVTILRVETSKDLRTARVYFSALADRSPSGGENSAAEAAQKALESSGGIIRRHVGGNVKMRYTPEFHFIYDRSAEFSARVEQTLTEIHHDDTGKSPKRAAKT